MKLMGPILLKEKSWQRKTKPSGRDGRGGGPSSSFLFPASSGAPEESPPRMLVGSFVPFFHFFSFFSFPADAANSFSSPVFFSPSLCTFVLFRNGSYLLPKRQEEEEREDRRRFGFSPRSFYFLERSLIFPSLPSLLANS